MDSTLVAEYLENLAKNVRSGIVVGVSVVETDQQGTVRMQVLCTPEKDSLNVPIKN